MYLNVRYQLQFYYNITTNFKKITKLIFLIPLGKKQSYVKHFTYVCKTKFVLFLAYMCVYVYAYVSLLKPNSFFFAILFHISI